MELGDNNMQGNNQPGQYGQNFGDGNQGQMGLGDNNMNNGMDNNQDGLNDNQDGDNMEDNEGVEEQLEEEPEVNADNIDEFIKSNNKEIKGLKKENKDLRDELKKLNDKLTKTLEKLRVRTYKRHEVSKSRAKTLVKELSNSQKKIESYQKEIDFLEAKVDQGDQMVIIQKLQEELYLKTKEEDMLKKEVRTKAKNAKLTEKRIKKSLNDQNHTNQLNFLIEETKFLKKQGKKLTEEDIKSEQAYEKQLQFAQKLEGRYKQLCAEVGEPEKVNITWGQEKVEFKKNVEKAPVSVKPKKITKVSQHWTEDTPDKFQVVMNPKHFENLKEKVRTLKKSLKIKKKQNTAKEAKIADRVDKMKKEGKNLDGKIVEKEKEYELLVKKLNESKKGMKHGALLPLENMIKIKELEDEEGNVIIKVGSCENLIPGDTKVVKENNRIKVRNLKIWIEENKIVGMQSEYSPHINSVFYGKLIAALPKVVSLSVTTITKVKAVTQGAELIGLAFTGKDGNVQKFGIIPTQNTSQAQQTQEGEQNVGEQGQEQEQQQEGEDKKKDKKVEEPYADEEPPAIEEEVVPLPEGAEVSEADILDYDRVLKVHVYGMNNVISGIGIQITT